VNRRRCVVLFEGYYEWRSSEGTSDGKRAAKKTPFYISSNSSPLLWVAGLFDEWRTAKADDTPLFSCSVVTTDALPSLSHIHHRMPAVLLEEECQLWLSASSVNIAVCLSAISDLRGRLSASLKVTEVGPFVNSVANDSEECIRPAAAAAAAAEEKKRTPSLLDFFSRESEKKKREKAEDLDAAAKTPLSESAAKRMENDSEVIGVDSISDSAAERPQKKQKSL
jgi:hypothetical protein